MVALDDDLELLVRRQPGPGRDEPAHDDVLLETAQWSVLPAIAASVSTLVVSWKDSTLMNDSVERLALVMPRRRPRRSPAAAALDDPLVLLLEEVLLDLLVDEEVRVADVLDADAPEHLANDDLDVLVVDGDALQAVDLLDLVDEIGRQLLLALTRRMSCGFAGPSMSGSPARTRSPG